MRVIRDGVGDITKDGTIVHTNVRYQVDDTGRVAVWSNVRGEPAFVYAPGEVEYKLTRKPCSCKGDASKMGLTRLWMNYDKALANAG